MIVGKRSVAPLFPKSAASLCSTGSAFLSHPPHHTLSQVFVRAPPPLTLPSPARRVPLTSGGLVPAELLGVPAHPRSSAFPLRARFGPEALRASPNPYVPPPLYLRTSHRSLITLLSPMSAPRRRVGNLQSRLINAFLI